MITERAVKLLHFHFRLMSKQNTFAYFWDSEKMELITPQKKTWRFWLAVANPIWIFINIVYMTYSVFENSMKEEEEQYPAWMSLFNLYIVILLISGFGFQINSLVYRNEICQLHRQILTCHHDLLGIYRSYGETKGDHGYNIDMLSLIYPATMAYFYSMGSCLALLFFVISNARYYIYSLLPAHISSNWWVKISWTAWELYQYLNLFSVFTFYLNTIFLYGFMVCFWLRCILKRSNEKAYTSRLQQIQTYTKLQLVTGTFNDCMRSYGSPNIKGIHLTVTILYTYQTIRHLSHMPLVLAMILPAGVAFGIGIIPILYPTIGKVYDLCDEFHRSANQWQELLVRKKVGSLQRYGIHINFWYPIKKITTLAIMGFFMQAVLNLLIIL